MYGRPPQSYAAAPLDQLGISTLQVTQQRPYYFYVGFKISMNYTLLLFLDLITIQVPNFFPTCMEFQARLNTFISYVCIFFFLYICKVHIFWEGHKILRNLHQLFDWQYIVGQIIGGDFAKFCGLLRMYEFYQNMSSIKLVCLTKETNKKTPIS